MPTYAYKCCEYEAVLYKIRIDDRVRPCPSCGIDMEPLINREHAANIQSSYVDNRVYNNGQGFFDKGLGKVISSRGQHKAIMREKGVEVFTGNLDDVMNAQEPKEPKPLPLEKVKDYFDESVQRVRNGEKVAHGTFTDAPPIRVNTNGMQKV